MNKTISYLNIFNDNKSKTLEELIDFISNKIKTVLNDYPQLKTLFKNALLWLKAVYLKDPDLKVKEDNHYLKLGTIIYRANKVMFSIIECEDKGDGFSILKDTIYVSNKEYDDLNKETKIIKLVLKKDDKNEISIPQLINGWKENKWKEANNVISLS